MKWNHIREKQPENGKSIVQIDGPYNGSYSIGMRIYVQDCSFAEVIDFCIDNGIGIPNFWWMYVEDFPFPDKKRDSFL